MTATPTAHSIATYGAKICLTLLFAFPLLPLRLSAVLVIPFGLFSLLAFLTSPNKMPQGSALLWLGAFALLPFLYLSELLYAENLDYVWGIVQRKMALLFLPLSFYLCYRASISFKLKQLLYVFTSGTLGLALYAAAMLLIHGFHSDYLETGGFAFALRTTVEELIGLHPTYFSLYLAFSSLVLLHELVARPSAIGMKMLQLAGIVLAAIALVALSARMVLFAWGIAVLVWVLQQKHFIRSYWKITLALLVPLVVAAFFIPSLQERVLELFTSSPNSTNIRSVLMDCALQQLSGNWLWGAQVEFLQPALNACYLSTGHPMATSSIIYNTHNEYLNIFIGKGLLGISAFGVLLFTLFKRAWKHPLFLVTILLFAIVCFTENLLERQHGVFFLALIGGYFLFNSTSSYKTKVL